MSDETIRLDSVTTVRRPALEHGTSRRCGDFLEMSATSDDLHMAVRRVILSGADVVLFGDQAIALLTAAIEGVETKRRSASVCLVPSKWGDDE